VSGIPLSLGEALGVAKQIRESKYADTQYWPWVIEELVKRIEELEEGKEDKMDIHPSQR
jgi:hypothetical protein